MIGEKNHSTPFSWRAGSIKRRLMIWGLALLGAALSLNTIAGSLYTRRQMQRATTALQVEMASLTARHIQSFINRKIERLEDTGVAMSLHPLAGEQQKLLAMLLLKNDRSFTELSMLDDRGNELAKFSERKLYLPADLKDRSQSEKFRKAVAGSYFGPVYTSDRAEPYVTMAIPLRAGPNKVVGVLAAEANLKFLWEVIGQSKFGRGGYAYLVDRNGILIAHQDPSLVLKKVNLRHLPKVGQYLGNLTTADAAPGQEGQGIAGDPVLSTFAPVPELGWAVIVEEPVEAALADAKTLERYAILLLGLGLLFGAVIIAWVSNRISRPIRELQHGVEIVRSGDLDHRTHIKTGDEIEELAGEFNEMAEALQISYSTLEQKVEQRTQEVSALYEVTSKVNKSLDLNEILEAVIAKIMEIFGFECTRIFLFNDQMEMLELRASFEVDPKNWTGVRSIKRGQGVLGRVADSGEPLIFEDVRTDPRYAALSTSRATHNAQMSFFAVFPIKTQSRVLGAILFNGRSPRKLTSDEVRLLTSMSEHLGLAVEKASLFRQSETRAQQLSVLNTIGAAVSQSLDLEVLLKGAVEKITETLNFDASWIYILEASEGYLRLTAYKGFSEEVAQSMDRRPVALGIAGKIFETGQPMVFEDIQNDPRYQEISSRSRVSSLGFNTSGGFPIRAKDKVIGVLHVANKVRRQVTADEIQLLESIAQEIGVAAENARLFTDLKEKTSELAKANQDLLDATRAKSEFIAAMSHELRTPLNVIMGNAELTRDGFFGDVNPDQKKSMTQIWHHSEFLLKMVNDVLALSRLDARKVSMDLATVDIDEVISHVQSHAEHLSRRNGLQVCWNVERNLPPIITDATKLEEILQNLIGNAFKFTPQGRIVVQVKNIRERDCVEFRVADTGIGIEPQDLGRIFGAFEQIKEAHTGDFNGVGLGLSIVKQYLELMKGDIRVESQPGQGTTFIFSVPRSIPLPS